MWMTVDGNVSVQMCLDRLVIGYFYPGNHGRIYVAIFLYWFTAYIAGYTTSSKLKELIGAEAHDWMVSLNLFYGFIIGIAFTSIYNREFPGDERHIRRKVYTIISLRKFALLNTQPW